MPPTPDPPFDPQQQGISLDELAAAFAKVMGVEPQRAGESPATSPQPPASPETPTASVEMEAVAASAAESPPPVVEEDTCPISPRSILEAMLFVGNSDNRPISPSRAAELMRDVEVDEIPSLVNELNHRYKSNGSPYHIVGEGDGYRLTLQDEFRSMRSRFYGRIREARLSQAAIDVLALVAYQQPITGEKIRKLRGKPSSHLLAHLVRRGLLRIERPDPKRRTPHYCTADRFLKLFNLTSLDDLPRSEDPG
jgi:segregation and condensation protein B